MGAIVALMMMLVLGALGGAVAFLAAGETRTAGNHHSAAEVLYGADVAIALALNALVAVPDWIPLLGGGVTSPLVDGAPGGLRRTVAGAIDLGEATNEVRCGHRAPCTAEEIAATTEERPWGPNNPVWQLYAYGPLSDLIPLEGVGSHVYVVVWVGDDRSECDGRSDIDGGPCASGASRGRDALALLAHAYGAYGMRRAVEVSVARTDMSGVRITSWREVR